MNATMRIEGEVEAATPPVPAAAIVTSPAGPPLAVDLDGTLLRTDLLLESLLVLLKHAPWRILSLPLWLLRGRAYLKQQVARRVALEVDILPYRQDLLDHLKAERAGGRTLVLATAADRVLAQQVADHLGIFDLVLASDGRVNLSGEAKGRLLVSKFGEKGFDYVGNSRHDLAVWASARQAIAVDAGRQAGRLKVLRPLHWIKNLLVFAPLLAAHRMHEFALVGKLAMAFVALGCVASSAYVINDLLDLAVDRRHPNKRLRPFASGTLPITYALWAAPALFGLGCLIAGLVSGLFLGAALTYFVLSLTYSLYVKQIVILDVIFLAGLYTMRVLAGSAAVAIWPSHWLLAFSTFVFFSMALVKRYGELMVMKRVDGEGARARGYELSDSELLAAMGVASGYLAVLVLALYINSDTAQVLYGRYQLIWFLCPLLLFWISHVWLVAHRGRMPDDPVTFALQDRTSWIVAALILTISWWAL